MERVPKSSENQLQEKIIENESSNSDLNLSYEIDRLKTFANWTAPDVNKDDLAAVGLYFVQQDNVIKCAFCDIKIVDFTSDTLTSHKCLNQSVEKNLKDSKKSNDSVVNEKVKNNGDEDSTSITVIEKSAREAWLDKIGIRGNITPKFPHYSILKDRLKSYTFWTSQNQQPSVLSEAGFFYIGVEDRTACFHCGGGLREWKSTDDPWIEHAHWFPKCNFILNVKGKEFIDQAWSRKLNVSTPKEMKNAADALKDLIDVISTKKKNPPKEKINSSFSKATKNIIPEKDSLFTCRICYEEERNVIFLPCHHVVSCRRCASFLKCCVVCRASIKDMMPAIHA